ncbi:SIS domain-containing protein [bacterium]|jgi:D-sedoheptulose 7-phosphate isomerase|nr:SIS domain-containing protein [bacterium]
MDPKAYLLQTATESRAAFDDFLTLNQDSLVQAARKIGQCVKEGGKLLILGNGGSAADAQHMAAEMVGKMLVDRRPLPAIALTTDSSNITAIGNDFGYDQVFVKQVQALAKAGDVVLAISTSGNSKNVIFAVEEAKKKGCLVITLTGGSGGKLKALGDLALNVAQGKNSSRIQESHIFAVHSMVDLLDRFFLD